MQGAVRDRLATANDIDHGRHEPRDDEQASHGQGGPPDHGQPRGLHGGHDVRDSARAHDDRPDDGREQSHRG